MPFSGRNNTKTASAAAVTGAVTYQQLSAKMYVNTTGWTTVGVSSMGGVNGTYGTVSFNPSSKVATGTKTNYCVQGIGCYTAFSATVTVPAKTEYTVKFSFAQTFTLTRQSGGTAPARGDVFYYGNTADDPAASDKSSGMTISCYLGNRPTSADGKNYVVSTITYADSGSDNGTKRANGSIPAITMTNNSDTVQTYVAYFGYSAGCCTASSSKNQYSSSVTMSETVYETVSAKVDNSSVNYDSDNHNFTFIYNENKVAISKIVDNTGATLYTHDVTGADPDSGANPLNGNVWTASLSGTYTVSFDILPGCTATWAPSDTDTDTKDVSFTIKKAVVPVPTLASLSEQPFTGISCPFRFTDVSELIDITVDSTDMTVGATDASGNCVLEATKGGTYNVTYTLKDTDNCEWATGGSDPLTLTGGLKITPKSTSISATTTTGDWEWKKNKSMEITARIPGIDSADKATLELKASYSQTGVNVPFPVSVAYDSVTDSYKLTIPNNLNISEYTLTIELENASSTNSNSNYNITAFTQTFEVLAPDASFTEDDIIWQYTVDGGSPVKIGKADLDGSGVLQLDYVGKEYTFKVFDDTLAAESYVQVKANSYTGDKKKTDCGTYSVSVVIEAYDSSIMAFPDTTFTLNYKINQATIDLDELEWQWQYVGDGNKWNNFADGMPVFKKGYGVKTRVNPDNLPVGLTAADITTTDERPAPTTLGAHHTAVNFAPTLSNPNYVRPADFTYDWEITKTIVKIITWVPGVLPDSTDEDRAVKVVDCQDTYGNALKYLYSFSYTDAGGTVHTVTDNVLDGDTANPMGAEETLTLLYQYADKEHVINVSVRAELKDTGNYEFADGSVLTSTFDAGEGLTQAKVEVTGAGSTFGDVKLGVKVTVDGDPLPEPFYEIKICDKDGNELATLTPEQLKDPANYKAYLTDAGDYKIKVALTQVGEEGGYYLSGANVDYTIESKLVDLPVISEMTFTGYDVDLKEHFDDAFKKLIEDGIVTVTGGASYRNAGTYTAYLELAKNYKWNLPKEEEEVAPVRLALASDEAAKPVVRGNKLELPWTINRAKLVSNWNLKGKDGAKNNALVPWQEKINDGTVDVGMDYRYYDNSKVQLSEVEFKGGSTFFVDAFLYGEDADNFEFEGGVGESKQATAMVEYKVPKSGAAAMLSGVKDFATKTWLGLPIWAWLLIALALIILLIIIIVVAKKRRKSKEEREEIKARKAEEKERREEERRLQQEKLQAERELAMAKQQAELEKIRAQAQAGAGMASMAMQQQMPQQPQQQMQQQPVQQPMQQPMQAQQPVQYVAATDNSVLAEIKAELAEIKARQNMMGGFVQPMQMPVQMPQYYQQPVQMPAQSGDATAVVLAKMEAEFAKMQLEFYKMHGGVPVNFTPQISAPPVQALPQPAQEEISQPVQAQYPSDAVITTTTTVDTTKKNETSTIRREREDGFADVDGFYDSID
ncbi:MAG: hypothetical protein K2N22_01435 [Clostridia bacterium]|nr:hypothetical protein [Clostridia bacterium]